MNFSKYSIENIRRSYKLLWASFKNYFNSAHKPDSAKN